MTTTPDLRSTVEALVNSLEDATIRVEDFDFGPAYEIALKERRAAIRKGRALLASPETANENRP